MKEKMNAAIATYKENTAAAEKENSKKSSRKKKTALSIILCLIALIIILFFFWYLYERNQNTWDIKEYTIIYEYGSPISISLADLVDTAKYPSVTTENTNFYLYLSDDETGEEKNINLENLEDDLYLGIGNYTININHQTSYTIFSFSIFSFEETKTMELSIRDTVAPVFSDECPSEIFVVQNGKIKDLAKLFSVDDMTNVNLTIDENSYDLSSAGKYPVQITATDTSGNSSYLDVSINVVDSDKIETGRKVTLINPDNPLPDNWKVSLKKIYSNQYADADAYDSLMKMLSDCTKAGYNPVVCSSYRSHSKQETLFENKINSYIENGYSKKDAKKLAATWVAVPGSSEHESGLAFDIVSKEYQTLDEKQAKTECQKWLMKHCTEYGFILRYPKNKTEITGINYEPWHYRYVGKKAAKYMYKNDLCLEEYYSYFCE